jgi:hypothetical protein
VLAALEHVGLAHPAPPIAPAGARTPQRPPLRELSELWARSASVLEDTEVSGYLAGRGIDPGLVADRDLARAISPDLSLLVLPAWASLGGPWPRRGYRLLLPLWDAAGHVVSVHARSIIAGSEPKGALPCGFGIAGTVLADAAGARMLARREIAGPLWITEGATDFLTAATAWGDAAEPAPAVLGILSGSWTSQLAARVLDGARVVIAVDHDPSGELYVAKIAASLVGRVRLERWTPCGRDTA